jgi:ribosomal protein S18 acetylase RimI-like enzyme
VNDGPAPVRPGPAGARGYDATSDADWWAIRGLLVRTHAAVPPGWNWDIRRWDGRRFHNEDPVLPPSFTDGIGLWEAGGVLVGAVHGEGGGDAFLELDPAWRDLEPAMLDWAEAHLAAVHDGRRRLEVVAWAADERRVAALRARGYVRGAEVWARRLTLDGRPIPVPEVAAGYRLRTTSRATLGHDAAGIAGLLNASFRRSLHTAAEYRTFATRSPSFRHDLNLVAEAPDGSFAAHVGLTLDEANRHGIVEPVCTHPEHRRHGLARALILEGMRRLGDLGARTCDVETGDMAAANALYRSLPFREELGGHAWTRDLGSAAERVPPAGAPPAARAS